MNPVKKVLFVCTYWGVRSQIAEVLTSALGGSGLSAESAGLEDGTISPFVRQLMERRGLILQGSSPPTIFQRVRDKAGYDYVVTLCSHETQENYEVLLGIVDQLFGAGAEVRHWNIADFMSIRAEGEARVEAAEAIVRDIEGHVLQLSQEVCGCRSPIGAL